MKYGKYVSLNYSFIVIQSFYYSLLGKRQNIVRFIRDALWWNDRDWNAIQ